MTVAREMDSTTAIVLGAIFGSLFVLTCVVSAIKAVKDRKKIKERIAEKERRRSKEAGSSIEDSDTRPTTSRDYKGGKNVENGGKHPLHVPCVGYHPGQYPNTQNGVDNLTYAHSHSELKHSGHDPQSKITTVDLIPSQTYMPSKRTAPCERTDRSHLDHLPPECLAVQKILRRHSYEMAVCEHSWLPADIPAFASSESIVNTYSFGNRPIVRTTTVGFENRAYDTEDYKLS